jgi:UDP-N-acetylmuramate: L-alanyl-gamma-D-glutamyl-meso-diaminopimelate ligase
MGCWTPVETFGIGAGDWQAHLLADDASRFTVRRAGQDVAEVDWALMGRHNALNALAAIAAAARVGVAPGEAGEALGRFENVKRRMELRGEVGGIRLYDDFAHHPTAIATTLDGLRRNAPGARIVAVLEPRSNTMRMGVHRDTLADALAGADRVVVYLPPDLDWNLQAALAPLQAPPAVFDKIEAIIADVVDHSLPGDRIVVMSNGGFGGIHARLLQALARKHSLEAAVP